MHVLANTITADMGMIPGLAFAGPALGLPLSVLAGFVERPFYARAGVERHAIWYALQANLVSLVAGFVATLLAALLSDSARRYDAFFTVWPFLAVGVSVVVERSYLEARARAGRAGAGPAVSWGWSAAGNVTSAALCVGVLFLVVYLRSAFPGLRRALAPYAGPLQAIAFLGSAALFAASFIRPRERTAADAVGHG